MDDRRTMLLLRAAAIFNMAGGTIMMVFPTWVFGILYAKNLTSSDTLLRTYHMLLFGFVVAIGVGFWVASTRPRENRGILIASALGKTLAAVVWLRMCAVGEGTWLLGMASITDLAWAASFVVVLRRAE